MVWRELTWSCLQPDLIKSRVGTKANFGVPQSGPAFSLVSYWIFPAKRLMVGPFICKKLNYSLEHRFHGLLGTKRYNLGKRLPSTATDAGYVVENAKQELFPDLCTSKSFSRPHVSNDNSYSDSMINTIRYIPTFPYRFASFQESRGLMCKFVRWCYENHMHSGKNVFTPNDVHTVVLRSICVPAFEPDWSA